MAVPSSLGKIAATAAAAMAGSACLYDVHKQGVRSATLTREKNYADDFIAQEIGSSKLNYPSAKHAAIKNWMLNFKFPHKFSEIVNTVGGYFKGAVKGIANNFAPLACSALTIFLGANKKIASKHPNLQKYALFATGITTAWDFIKNGTNLFERTDYLKK